jgi:hypothetical protein
MDVKSSRFVDRGFARRTSDAKLASAKDKAHNNRYGPDRQRPNRKRNRSSKKRNMCIQCQEKRALTNLSGWSKQLCTTCAKKNGCSFPLTKILNKRKVKKEPVAKKQPEALLKKKVNAQRKVKKEQEGVEKRQKMWKLIRQPGPAIELPEDSEHSEVSEHEDGVVKKDMKKDKRLMEAFRKAEDRRRRYQSPQKKQKDWAIDYRLVLVFFSKRFET